MPTKTSKLKKLKQTNGRVENSQNPQITNLDVFFGMGNYTKYKTHNVDEYTKFLGELSYGELQNHARDVGLMPLDSVSRLKNSLIEEFKKVTAPYRSSAEPTLKQKNSFSDFDPVVKKILAEQK